MNFWNFWSHILDSSSVGNSGKLEGHSKNKTHGQNGASSWIILFRSCNCWKMHGETILVSFSPVTIYYPFFRLIKLTRQNRLKLCGIIRFNFQVTQTAILSIIILKQYRLDRFLLLVSISYVQCVIPWFSCNWENNLYSSIILILSGSVLRSKRSPCPLHHTGIVHIIGIWYCDSFWDCRLQFT